LIGSSRHSTNPIGRFGKISQIRLSSLHCLPKISLIHDVVSIEDGPCFVAADRHGYSLGDACPDHVPNSGPAEVVEDAPDVARLAVALFTPMALNCPVAAVARELAQARRDTRRCPWHARSFAPVRVLV